MASRGARGHLSREPNRLSHNGMCDRREYSRGRRHDRVRRASEKGAERVKSGKTGGICLELAAE